MSPLKKLVPPTVLGLLLSEVTLIIACYGLILIASLETDPWIFAWHDLGFIRVGIVAAVIVGGLYMQDLYVDLRAANRALLVQQICLALGLAFLLQALLNYLDSPLVVPRVPMFFGSALVLLSLAAWRVIYSRLVQSAVHAERVIFLGCSRIARRIEERFVERPELGLVSIGCIAEKVGTPVDGTRVLGELPQFGEIVERYAPDRVVVALDERRNRMPGEALLELQFRGVQVEDAAVTYERVFDRVCVERLRPAQLIFSSEFGPRGSTLLLQSAYSVIIAAMTAVVALPLAILVALLVKLNSRGPVLYRQRRTGFRGREFTLYKFRSMYVDAERDRGPVWARKDDPRVTPVGRWLRKFRIDEIPQLWNVVKGDMVIVGPRPERPEFVSELIAEVPFYRQRLVVKPGITGWAQINHRYGDSVEDTLTKLEFDLFYIKNWTPALDLYIMFHTAKVILLGRGAQ